MAAAKSKGYPPDFSRNVLQHQERTREQAAWELLSAVRDLFPDRFLELRDFRDLIPLVYEGDADLNDAGIQASEARFWDAVCEWTSKNGIASEVVNRVAAERALGNTVGGGVTCGYLDEHGNEVEPPSLWVDPFTEEREDFLRRADRFYREVVEFYRKRTGAKPPGAVKRNLEHFRWLAAHLVGGCSFARIADGDNPFGLSASSDKTVAGECGKLAALIGISMLVSPGPRRGCPIRKAAHRARR
jgi:hypothetical protein